MWRHERDALSLMSGLLLVLVAGLFLLSDLTAVDLDGRWVAPAVLLGVGVAGLVSSLARRDSDSDSHSEAGSGSVRL